jgi:hypothetical protein
MDADLLFSIGFHEGLRKYFTTRFLRRGAWMPVPGQGRCQAPAPGDGRNRRALLAARGCRAPDATGGRAYRRPSVFRVKRLISARIR